MAKASEDDRIADLKREVADLRHQMTLIVAFLDGEVRESRGLTLDRIRAEWRRHQR
jgi:hypothetical protein